MRSIAFVLSLILVFILPFEGILRVPGLGTLAKIFGLAAGALWLGTVIITNRLRKPRPFQALLCLFVLWNAVSIFWSADPNRTLAHLFTWIQLLVLVFILWDLYTTRTALLAALQAYVLGSYVAVGSAVRNFLAGDAFYSNYERFSAGETNPDGFAFLLVLAIPIAWYLAGMKSTGRSSQFLRIVNYLYIPAAFFGLALSGTRTALVASIVGTAYGLASLNRLRPWVRMVILMLLVSAVMYLIPYVQSLKSFQRLGTTGTELTQGDLNNRTNNWSEGMAVFAEHPLLGIGSYMYRSVNSLGKVAHNSFVSVLVELGLVGFVLFGAILTIVGLQVWKHPHNWDRWFWLTIFAVWGIGSFTLTWEHRKTTWLFLSLIIASAALIGRGEEAEETVQPIEAGIPAVSRSNSPQDFKDRPHPA